MRIRWEAIGLALAMAVGTALAGWWTVPLVAMLWGLRRPPGLALVSGLVAWSALLAWQATRGPVRELADRLAGVLSIPWWAILAAGPLFAGLMAWAGAELGAAVARRRAAAG